MIIGAASSRWMFPKALDEKGLPVAGGKNSALRVEFRR
jgi:hypothetical protein